jgi:cold shock CspA family protein
MATGTVTTIRNDRGFGFLAPDDAPRPDSKDLFFHHTAVPGGFELLREGQRVTFEQAPDPRDPRRARATDVRPLAEAT